MGVEEGPSEFINHGELTEEEKQALTSEQKSFQETREKVSPTDAEAIAGIINKIIVEHAEADKKMTAIEAAKTLNLPADKIQIMEQLRFGSMKREALDTIEALEIADHMIADALLSSQGEARNFFELNVIGSLRAEKIKKILAARLYKSEGENDPVVPGLTFSAQSGKDSPASSEKQMITVRYNPEGKNSQS